MMTDMIISAGMNTVRVLTIKIIENMLANIALYISQGRNVLSFLLRPSPGEALCLSRDDAADDDGALPS